MGEARDGELFELEEDDSASFGPGRRFLLFALGPVELALELSRLEEIVEPGPITRAPGTPPWVLGALNLRGLALPVIDLANKLGLAARADRSHRPAILVFRPTDATGRLGAWVTNVLGFVEVPEQALAPAPRFGAAISLDLLAGLVAVDDRFVPVLDLSKAASVAASVSAPAAEAPAASSASPAG
jgi:purine-binding chemotaxis protein CheW